MTKRVRSVVDPCAICGHYHNYDGGEVCPVCGHTQLDELDPNLAGHCSGDFTLLSITDPIIDFDKTGEFLERSRQCHERVFAHCISGNNRSAAAVVAYLMRQWRWSLLQSFVTVKDIRPAIDISSEILEQLKMYEAKLFRSTASEVVAQITPEVHIRIDSLSEQEPFNKNPSCTFGDAMDLSASNNYVIEGLEHNKPTSENPFIEIPVETLDQSMETF